MTLQWLEKTWHTHQRISAWTDHQSPNETSPGPFHWSRLPSDNLQCLTILLQRPGGSAAPGPGPDFSKVPFCYRVKRRYLTNPKPLNYFKTAHMTLPYLLPGTGESCYICSFLYTTTSSATWQRFSLRIKMTRCFDLHRLLCPDPDQVYICKAVVIFRVPIKVIRRIPILVHPLIMETHLCLLYENIRKALFFAYQRKPSNLGDEHFILIFCISCEKKMYLPASPSRNLWHRFSLRGKFKNHLDDNLNASCLHCCRGGTKTLEP